MSLVLIGILSGSETDVDCGLSSGCGLCANTKKCLTVGDCTSNDCNDGYCGYANGITCASNSDCASGTCDSTLTICTGKLGSTCSAPTQCSHGLYCNLILTVNLTKCVATSCEDGTQHSLVPFPSYASTSML
jgi:hypothetical protein